MTENKTSADPSNDRTLKLRQSACVLAGSSEMEHYLIVTRWQHPPSRGPADAAADAIDLASSGCSNSDPLSVHNSATTCPPVRGSQSFMFIPWRKHFAAHNESNNKQQYDSKMQRSATTYIPPYKREIRGLIINDKKQRAF